MRDSAFGLRSIALLTPGITPYVTGGIQRHSFNLAKHLAQTGIKVDLYHTVFPGSEDISELVGMTDAEKKNIFSIEIAWQNRRFPGHYIRSLKAFSEAALRIYRTRPKVDFIMAKSLTAWSFVEAKRRAEQLPPIAVNFHGYEMFQPRPTFRTKMEAALLRPTFLVHAQRADHVVSYGGRVTEILHKNMCLPREKIIEIPGGTDPALLSGHPPPTGTKRRFVFLGRYERRKGIEELNAAIMQNPGWAERSQFRFIGGIPKNRQLDLPHVTYVGELRSPAKIQAHLRTADVLLCPSHSEGMPNVIMEGMAAGLAILATDVGAVRLLVSENNGIVLPRSSRQGIEQAVQRFLAMPNEELNQLKQASLGHVRKFFWPTIAERTRSTLADLIKEKEGTG